jgi:hypothetical protein
MIELPKARVAASTCVGPQGNQAVLPAVWDRLPFPSETRQLRETKFRKRFADFAAPAAPVHEAA